MEEANLKLWRWLALLLGVLLLFGVHTRAISSNDQSRLALIESLLNRGVAYTNDSPFFNTVDMVFVDGKFYSDKPPVLSLITTALLFPFAPYVSSNMQVLYVASVLVTSGVVLLVLPFILERIGRELELPFHQLRWLHIGIVLGSPLLLYWLVYNDHAAELGVALITFLYAVRHVRQPQGKTAVILGALSGFMWLLHPLVGTVFLGTTFLLVFFAGDDTGWKYLVSAAATLCVGFFAQWLIYGTWIPFYFQPELYIYGPSTLHDIPQSYWLFNPKPPGLTEKNITARFSELGMSQETLQQTLEALREYKASTESPWQFMWNRWRHYDVLTFTPVVIYGAYLAFREYRTSKHRLVYTWVAVTSVGLFAAAVVLRAVPGDSFGNRHLLPIIPLILVAAAPALTKNRMYMFKILLWISLGMALPGIERVWRTPSDIFLSINQLIWILSIIFMVATIRYSSLVGRLQTFYTSHKEITVLMLVFYLLSQLFYYGYFQGDTLGFMRLFYVAMALLYIWGSTWVYTLLKKPEKFSWKRELKGVEKYTKG